MIRNAILRGPVFDPSSYHFVAKGCERGTPGFVMRSGELIQFSECPMKWRDGAVEENTDAMEYGSLLDCLALTPEQFKARYAVEPEFYETTGMECPSCKTVTDSKKCRACGCERVEIIVKKDWSTASDHCKEWTLAQLKSGKNPVSQWLFNKAFAAVKRLQRDPIICAFIAASDKQVLVTAEWHDEATGLIVPLKCMIDAVPRLGTQFEKKLADLKTSNTTNPEAWPKKVHRFKYHWQAAFYQDIYRAARPDEDRPDYCHLVQESSEPYQTARRVVAGDAMKNGRAGYRRALENYCWCLKHDTWPDNDCDDTGTPGWGLYEWNPYWDAEDAFMPKYTTPVGETSTEPEPDLTP